MHEWHSADVGALGSKSKPLGGGLFAKDVPPDFICGQKIPRLGVSRVSIIDSGKVCELHHWVGWV